MSNGSHQEKYFSKLIIAFASVIGSILIIFYAIFELDKDHNWYFWAIVAAFLMCSGIYFALQAFVHKIKSDFSKRQKLRDQQKTFTAD